MPIIIKNMIVEPLHNTAREAQWRKFELSKTNLNICKHVERAIGDGIQTVRHVLPAKNEI